MDKSHNLLIADGDSRLRYLLVDTFSEEGYQVMETGNSQEALKLALSQTLDFIIIDLNLTDIKGLDLLVKIRDKKNTPIMILSDNPSDYERIQAFEYGADDLVVKPFLWKEIFLRVEAIINRLEKTTKFTEKEKISSPPLTMEFHSRTVLVDENKIDFTPKEYELLYFLMTHPNEIFSREVLIDKIWREDYKGNIRTVDTHIKRIREKIAKESADASEMIETIWGLGYKFNS